MIQSNFHTHTRFSDGKKEAEDYCKKALEIGFHSLGFSDHAPVLFSNKYSIEPQRLDDYFSTILSLKEKYKGQLSIYLSLEADFIPNSTHPFDYFREKAPMDYIIGSVHLVYHQMKKEMWFIDGGDQDLWDMGLRDIFEGDIKTAVYAFYEQTMEMIETQNPEVIGHLDKIKMHNKERYFSQKDDWYQALIEETLKLIKKKNAILEINTRGIYKGRCKELFPSKSILLQAQKMGIPMMLSSDAHHPDELNGAFPQALSILKNIGIGELFEFHLGNWKAVLI
jgi:histidinol-phosphatase (PHP family)